MSLHAGAFEDGIADGIVSPSLGRIKALRISIHSGSPMWVLLSEVRRQKEETMKR